jgi:hypothetical protein
MAGDQEAVDPGAARGLIRVERIASSAHLSSYRQLLSPHSKHEKRMRADIRLKLARRPGLLLGLLPTWSTSQDRERCLGTYSP